MTDSSSSSAAEEPTGNDRHRRRRLVPIAWIGGAAAAALLVLGSSGTLSSWTTAIIGNDTNTVAVTNAVILKETGPTPGNVTCLSSDSGISNNYTCSGINKYGGIGSPLSPGGNQTVTVTLANVGTESGALTLKAGACTPGGSGITTGALNVCDALQVAVACPSGTPTYPASGTTSLTTFAGATASPVASLARDTSITCTFTVSLPASTSPVYAGQTASQPLTWTLSGA